MEESLRLAVGRVILARVTAIAADPVMRGTEFPETAVLSGSVKLQMLPSQSKTPSIVGQFSSVSIASEPGASRGMDAPVFASTPRSPT
ncbi:hypothetical protein ACEPAI_6975 [Sanghuangporus weigelae]